MAFRLATGADGAGHDGTGVEGPGTRVERLGDLQSKTKFKKSELTMEVGGWVHSDFVFEKSSQNRPKPGLIFWNVFCLYNHRTSLNVVSYYDLSVLSMSVMGFQ